MTNPIIMKRTPYFPFVLVLLLYSGAIESSAFGQLAREQSKEYIDSTLLSENLVSLNGKPLTLYSVGFDIRANTLQKLFHDCINYYEGNFPEKNSPLISLS